MKINKISAVAIAAAMVVGGLTVAQSAQADVIPGSITISPTSGNVNTDTVFLSSVATSVGAPVGFRAASTSQIFQDGVLVGNISNLRLTNMASTNGTNGLDGNPAFMDRSLNPTNNFVSNKMLNAAALSTLHTGNFEYRYYFHALSTSLDLVNDKYLTLTLTYDSVTGAWGLPAAAAIATTTSLSGGVTSNAGEVSLTATVKNPANATATAAAGSIVFKDGATTVATVPVASGAATALLTGVANGAHSYTAEFQSSNAVYSGSTSSAANVNVGGPAPQGVTINVTVPTGVGSLTLSGVNSPIEMGTATVGTTLDASGTLNATVTDTRQVGDYPAWSLTGVVGDFHSGAKVLDGKYLGWTPSILASSTATGSAAGAVVAPATTTGTGLKVSSVLATGLPNVAGSVTNTAAALQLKAPLNTAAGAYSATLTLTLI